MDNTQTAGDVLRDIHLPQPVGFWPPAPGVWLATALLLLVAMGLLYWWYKKKQRTLYQQAQLTLDSIQNQPNTSELEKLQALSQFLKQLALSHDSRRHIASLTGPQWLAYLDQHMDEETSPFSDGPGHLLLDAPYRNQPLSSDQIEPVFQLSQRLLENMARKKK